MSLKSLLNRSIAAAFFAFVLIPAYSQAAFPGDIDQNGVVDLEDVILGLQILSGQSPAVPQISGGTDIDKDGKIGMAEVIHALTVVSQGGGNILPPDDPGASDLRFAIHSTEERKPISPFIYGTNFYDGSAPRNLTLTRLGGNRWTAYNWENNASNSGTDWGPYSNDSYLGGGNTPGEAVRPTIETGRANGYVSLITLQLQGYASADKDGLVDPNSSKRG